METSNLLRHRIIKDLMTENPEKVAVAAITLWEQMAILIISIIGEGGFNSLYERSLFLTHSTFPWLTVSLLSAHTDQRFGELKLNFERQTPAQASEANSMLLVTFTDILAALIGEQLTTHILRSAWGKSASLRGDKEFKND